MKKKTCRLSDPAYDIINLMRSHGYEAKILPPSDDSQDTSNVEEILAKILSDNSEKKSTK